MRSFERPSWILSVLTLALAAFTGLACPACRTQPPRILPPVADDARAAWARAEALLDQAQPGGDGAAVRTKARAELERAVELAPDWTLPRRALDELARAELRGVAVLAEHRAALARDPADPTALYLCGRLEGRRGGLRFEAAVRANATYAWGWHGLAFSAQQTGHVREAIAHARRAVELAREPSERVFFVQNLARLLAGARERQAAAELLADELAHGDLSARERRALSLLAVDLALDSSHLGLRGMAYERGLALLADEPLSEDQIAALGARLAGVSTFDDPDGERLVLALSRSSSPARDRLRGELLLAASPTPLALALLERDGVERMREPSGPVLRAARFSARQYRAAVERWLAELPDVVLDEHGRPRDPRLARVVELVLALDVNSAGAPTRAKALTELGDALVLAGWFREARAVAAELAEHALAEALTLDARALAGDEAVRGLVHVVTRADLRVLFHSPGRRDERSPAWDRLLGGRARVTEIDDLEGLLDALAAPLARSHAFLANTRDSHHAYASVHAEVLASPRLSYAPIGELVHPGPRFTAADEREGLGKRGEAVGGLAAELARLGRFGLFGELMGAGGPDGTMLPCLYTEERAGEHLGVKWSGTVAWCETAELKSRAGRAGAQISAAAVHEGYWLDIDAVRGELELWRALARAFEGEGGAERVEAVLAVRGLALEERSDAAARARERRAGTALLGEAQRLRLALLRERASGGAVLGSVTLDELVRVTGTHEEGHLCDRTRFLPVWKHLGAAFALALECGFSPARIQEQLEYRAQLTALVEVPEPRLPLAQVLDAAEGGSNGVTPHASAYVRLLDDFLHVLDETAASEPERFAVLDLDRTLVHQLHLIGAEDVRRVARILAARKIR